VNRAALYVRVSTTDQAEDGYSIDEQIARLKAYCEARGWIAAHVYKDAGFSGSNIRRPGVEDLIRDIASYDTVLIYKLDRLSRSQRDTLYLIEEVFEPAGVAFVSLSENFDTSSSFGRAMIGILSVFAQHEREQIEERMAMGKLGRIKSGKPSAWVIAPFGYTLVGGALIIDPLRAPIVRRMYADYATGRSVYEIWNWLNAEGHIGKDKAWRYTTVRRVLANIVYTGRSAYKGKVYESDHEAIVPIDLWEFVQEELKRRQVDAARASNNPRPFQAKYPLSGLLYCARCGSSLRIIQSSKRKDGSRLKYYTCRGRNEGCDAPNINFDEVEAGVFEAVERLRATKDLLVAPPAAPIDEAEITALEGRFKEITDALARLVDLYISGSIQMDVLDAKKDALEAERTGVEQTLAKLRDARPGPALSVEEAKVLLSALSGDIRKAPLEKQRVVVHGLIDRIVVDGGEAEIKWRFL
jgi:site-specific DNA recombinase